MAGDPAQWILARLAASGDIALSPPSESRGRFFDIRLIWSSRVQAIFKRVAALRALAACPHVDPKQAVEALNEAARIEQGGGGSQASDESLIATWNQMTGHDLTKSEDRDKVRAAVEAMRKREIEAAAELSRRRAAATAKTRRKPPHSGRMR